MKHILISFMLIGLISCRSYREKTRQENSWVNLAESSRSMRYGFQYLEKDSQNRTWYFVTDSILSFHPDYGLFSNGGQLHIRESRTGLQRLQVEVDSLEEARHMQASDMRKNQTRTWYNYVSWILVGVVGGAVAIMLWRRRTLS